MLEITKCSTDDIDRLARLNRQLIGDEESDNNMTLEELKAQMRGFLETEYNAYFFKNDAEIVGYALVRTSEKPLYLRQSGGKNGY